MRLLIKIKNLRLVTIKFIKYYFFLLIVNDFREVYIKSCGEFIMW